MNKLHHYKRVGFFLGIILLSAGGGVLASAITSSALIDYTTQLNVLSRPLQREGEKPQAYPKNFADALKLTRETSLESVVVFYAGAPSSENGYTKKDIVNSGVVVTADGWIMAPSMTMGDKGQLFAHVKDQLFPVSKIETDNFTNVSFVKIEATNLPVISFGEAYKLFSGNQVFVAENDKNIYAADVREVQRAIGTVVSSDAIVRNVSLDTVAQDQPRIIFDLAGAFVGFLPKKETLLVNMESLLPAWNAVLEKKEFTRATLGVNYVDLAHAVGFSEKRAYGNKIGAYVTGRSVVKKGSVAPKADLLPEDIILSLGGNEINETQSLAMLVEARKPSEKVILVIERNGEKKTVEVVLGESAN